MDILDRMNAVQNQLMWFDKILTKPNYPIPFE